MVNAISAADIAFIMSSSQAIVNWLNALDQSDFSFWVWCIIIRVNWNRILYNKYFYIDHLLTQTLLFCLFISLLLSIVSEVPVQEDTLMRTIIIGLSNELPLTAPETLEIADSLVRRVAAIKTPSPWIQSSQSGEDVFKLSSLSMPF